ncbi:MAG: hypothetical protein PGN26_15780 [Xylophilus ampelinus]
MNAAAQSAYTLTLPADGDASQSTVTVPRAAVIYIAFRLGQTLADQVQGAFGALGLDGLAARYVDRYRIWTECLQSAGASWLGAPSDAASYCWTATRAMGDERAVARLRAAHAEVEAAWAPLQALIVQCRALLEREGFGDGADGDPVPPAGSAQAA